MEATLSLFRNRERRRCSSPLSTVVSVSSASSSSLVRCASESALQRCGAPPPSTPVAHPVRRASRADSARSTDSSTSTASRQHEADAGSRPRSVVRMRSTSCSPRSSLASSDATDYPGAPRPSLMVKMNACTLLRQRELARRREKERREQHDRAWAERRRQLDRARLSDRLELVQRRTPEPGPSAKERLRALRRTTLEREAEYKREIQSMQARVRAMPLLLERQAVAAARRRLEQQYERKLKELGLSYEWIQEKAQQEPHDRQREQHSFSATQGSSSVTNQVAIPVGRGASVSGDPLSASRVDDGHSREAAVAQCVVQPALCAQPNRERERPVWNSARW
ncbi:hypothetical protein MTO96_033183 [Rhipicephalus appendiculatus]